MAVVKRICCFMNTDNAPEAEAWIAFFYEGSTRLPVCFAGPTEEAVKGAAEDFWLQESEKAARALGKKKAAA